MTAVVVRHDGRAGVPFLKLTFADRSAMEAIEAAYAYLKAEGWEGVFHATAVELHPPKEVSP